ncbi:MAG: cell division protein FtsQ/DivIB [Bacteroidota bacterium]
MKKYKVVISWMGILLYVLLISGFVNRRQELTLCNVIEVNVADSLMNRLIEPGEIVEFIDKKQNKIRGYPIGPINSLELEEKIKEFPAVKDAQVYKTINGTLCVNVIQRKPILRVIDKKGFGYYIDKEGVLLPLVNHYSAHLIVANGNIPAIDRSNLNQPVFGMDRKQIAVQTLFELHDFANYIYDDPFWKSQFVQVYRNAKGEYELIPRVGSHIIELGTMEDYQYKLHKLEGLYFKGLNALGWNEYERINLKFSNQVVCTKR